MVIAQSSKLIGKDTRLKTFHVVKGVVGSDDSGGAGDRPVLVVEDGEHGGGDDQIVMDEFTSGGITATVGDGPFDFFIGSGLDFVLAEFELLEVFLLEGG